MKFCYILLLFMCVYSNETVYEKVDKYMSSPEKAFDVGIAALILSQEKYPKINVKEYSSKIDQMIYIIRGIRFGYEAETGLPEEKIEKIRQFLYFSNVWNNYRPWKYDTRYDNAKIGSGDVMWLSYYIDNRLGNCISMPTLFYAIADRMNLSVWGANAPKHLYLKVRISNGEIYNIETSASGGQSNDSIIINTYSNITKKTISSPGYFKQLNKKQYIATIMNDISSWLMSEKKDTVLAIKYARLAIKYNDKQPEPYAILFRATNKIGYFNKFVEMGGMPKVIYKASYLKMLEETK